MGVVTAEDVEKIQAAMQTDAMLREVINEPGTTPEEVKDIEMVQQDLTAIVHASIKQ